MFGVLIWANVFNIAVLLFAVVLVLVMTFADKDGDNVVVDDDWYEYSLSILCIDISYVSKNKIQKLKLRI